MKHVLITLTALLLSGIAWGFTHGAAMVFDSTMLISIYLMLVDWGTQASKNEPSDLESEILKERLEKARAETKKAKAEYEEVMKNAGKYL